MGVDRLLDSEMDGWSLFGDFLCVCNTIASALYLHLNKQVDNDDDDVVTFEGVLRCKKASM